MTRDQDPDDDFDPATAPPSKGMRKRAAHAAQALGERLVTLREADLVALELPENLLEAIRLARRITARGGLARQRQYIGKLMRDIDAEPIRAALALLAAGKPTDQAEVTAAENWREALLQDPAALGRFGAEFPDADHAALATLVREARAERQRGGPPHRYRELFRRLKMLMAQRAANAAAAPADDDAE